MAASLFMRGVTKRLIGRTEEGDDDIATATAISPDVAEIFARYGLTP
jgi:hypothetical protein